EPARARTVLRRALHLAELCGATPLTRKIMAVDPSAGTPVPVEATTTLTRAERRVASLAMLGYTNREIAAKLYVTASTVEQHLTKIFRKLNVTGRGELPPALSYGASAAG